MTNTVLMSFSIDELKNMIKESLRELLGEGKLSNPENNAELLTIQEAARFLRLKVNTLYEKTWKKQIPHFKKGNKLYFNRKELANWIVNGKVSTAEEMEAAAITRELNSK